MTVKVNDTQRVLSEMEGQGRERSDWREVCIREVM